MPDYYYISAFKIFNLMRVPGSVSDPFSQTVFVMFFTGLKEPEIERFLPKII